MRRDFDEDDPKKPRPVQVPKKGGASPEAPWSHLRQDEDRDRHRHVC